MLQRIRRALGRPATGGDTQSIPSFSPPDLGRVMPPIAPAQEVAKFEEELEKLAGRTYRAGSKAELENILRKILASSTAERAVLSRNPLLARLGLVERLKAWGKSVTAWPEMPSDAQATAFREACFEADVGITGVDFVLAECGSLVLTSVTEGSQLVSLAPPVHVALYRPDQVTASLEEALDRLPVPSDSSQAMPGRSVVFITGTSRTADIEQILILGVHGPREVHAILVEDACLE